MKMRSVRRTAAVTVLAALIAVSGRVAAEDDLRHMVDDARKAAVQILTQIRGEVTKELERSGPLRAMVVCKYSAPEITSTISRQTGMRVTRVALRVRNRALGEADPWEQQALLDFEKRLAKGETIDTLEASEIVNEPAGRVFRYVKAIPMGQPCMNCHGPVSGLSEAVKAQLVNEYPFDRAVDFQVGQVRGAVSVKKSL
jgi:hypothetical protein